MKIKNPIKERRERKEAERRRKEEEAKRKQKRFSKKPLQKQAGQHTY